MTTWIRNYDGLGWSVIMRSMQKGFLFGLKFVGSEINCDKPSADRFSISLPSIVVSPSGHQICEWPLKSPEESCKWVFIFDFGI